MKEHITSRERVHLALSHIETDRVPFSLGFGVNEPVRVQLAQLLGLPGPEEVQKWLLGYSDLRWIAPCYRGPADREIRHNDGTYVDCWGVTRITKSYGAGAYEEISQYLLGDVTDISQLDDFLWPSPDWFDVFDIPNQIAKACEDGEKAIVVGNGNIFETSWYMRGFENMFRDLALQPELAYEIMRRVTDFFIVYFTKILVAAKGRVDIAFTADDLGHQNGLFMSIPMWEKMLKPHHVRLNKTLHEFGVKIMYHTDGAVMKVVPGLIDMGIDVLEALQFDAAGMDPVVLKRDFGDNLSFHGGISVQTTMPFGSPEAVRAEVEERVRVLGQGGGYILAPSHAIQAGTPLENVLALLEASGQDCTKR